MRKLQSAAALVVFIAIASGVDPGRAISQAVHLVVVNITDVAKGYRTSKLVHTGVLNDRNEKIGSLDDIVIGRDRVLFAILQVGGFLGMGGHLVAVPYQALQINDDGSKIVLPNASKEELKKLPEFVYRS
jgi:hypothetical protein